MIHDVQLLLVFLVHELERGRLVEGDPREIVCRSDFTSEDAPLVERCQKRLLRLASRYLRELEYSPTLVNFIDITLIEKRGPTAGVFMGYDIVQQLW